MYKRQPYTFNKINVNSYFRDCAEEVGLDMESRGIELGYFNYVNEDVEVIADAEQMKRVINNIISNSVKYLDKPKGIINIRIKEMCIRDRERYQRRPLPALQELTYGSNRTGNLKNNRDFAPDHSGPDPVCAIQRAACAGPVSGGGQHL